MPAAAGDGPRQRSGVATTTMASPRQIVVSDDEDRSRLRTGHGLQNITRLRRFGIDVIRSKGVYRVAQKM